MTRIAVPTQGELRGGEPVVVDETADHSNLSGKALIAAKKKHHIGPLKNRRAAGRRSRPNGSPKGAKRNKQQLIKALQKSAGEELAEKA